MTDAIVVEDITKRFEDVTALAGVTFAIEEDELFGLLGPNGAGKSTLIHILSTLLQPTSGHATVAGHDIRTDRDGVRENIGVVFQEPALDEELTARENLSFHGVMYGMPKEIRQERIEEVLSLVELDDRQGDLVKTFSGGMKRRLEIARGLVHRPAVLFLDEPTLGLDAQTRRHIWAYIQQLNRDSGVTIVLTTHYMEEADVLCDRIGVIDHGTLVELGEPDALKQAIGGDVITVTVEGNRTGFERRVADFEWVSALEDTGTDIRLTVDHGTDRIPVLFAGIADVDATITSVEIREPSLEDVFLELTGHAIREEDAESQIERMARRRRRR